MTLNVDKAKKLINIFCKLNEDNQDALLVTAFEMEIKQSIQESVSKSGKPTTQANIDNATDRFTNVAIPLVNRFDDMGPNHQAALAIFLNEMTKGALTKEEYIDFVVNSRQLSISEYIEKNIPGADIDEARKLYQIIKNEM